MKKLIILLVFCLKSITVNSQDFVCGANFFKKEKKQNKKEKFNDDEKLLIIPVSFHVVYNNNIEKISVTKIESLIKKLNNDFNQIKSGIDSDFHSIVSSPKIEFQLYDANNDCDETASITYHQTSYSKFLNNENNDTYLKKYGYIDSKKVLNIWICDLEDGIGGYSFLFDQLNIIGEERDGVVLDYKKTSDSFILIHEIGHYLNLMHIWGPTRGNEFNEPHVCGDDDVIADTPPQKGPSTPLLGFIKCIYSNNQECNNKKSNFQNYMDYSYCKGMFTKGQTDEMRRTILEFRPGLLETFSNIKNCNECGDIEDPLETSGNYILPSNDPSNTLVLNNDYTHINREAYLCFENDIDNYDFKISGKGTINITLTQLEKNFDIKLYKNGIIVKGSFNENPNSSAEQIKHYIDSNSTDDYTIAIYGDGYSENNGNGVFSDKPYKLNINWQPELSWWESWFTDYVEAFTVTNLNACKNEEKQFNVTVPSEFENKVDYLWIPSTGLSCDDCSNPKVILDKQTTYKLYTIPKNTLLTNDPKNGYSEQEVTVFINPTPTANAGSDKTIQNGESIQLQGSGGSSYLWSPTTGLSNPNIWNPIASPSETTTYTLTVTENGCTDTDTVTVIVDLGNGGGNAPSNDDCDNAKNLASSTSCNTTFGTIDFATADNISNKPSCDAITNPNSLGVFYSFIASSNTHTVEVNPTGTLDVVLTIYSGNSCSNLTEFACEDTSGGNGVKTSLTKNNFTIGDKYWIRVYDYGTFEPAIGQGGFNICVTHSDSSGGNGTDLVSNITSVSNRNPDSGDEITVNYTVSNLGDTATQFWLAPSIYLSSNQKLNNFDTYLASGKINQTINGNETVSLSTKINIPNISDKQYYLIINPDPANIITETNEENNLDFYSIQVGEVIENGPNLDVKKVTVTPNTNLAPGQEINVEIKIENDGNKDAGKFITLIVFDADNNGKYDSSKDIIIGSKSFSGIDKGEDKTRDEDVFLPTSISSIGTYRIIAIADSEDDITETDENDNDKSENIIISTLTPAGPDLIANYLSVEIDETNGKVSESNLCLNERYTFRFNTENIGNLEIGTGGTAIRTYAYISKDQYLDGTDVSIGFDDASTQLSAGEVNSGLAEEKLVGFSEGQHYLLLYPDRNGIVAETNEGNNITAIPIYISNCDNEALPDLKMDIISYTPYNNSLGDYLTVEMKISNIGASPISDFNVKLFLSEDQIFHAYGNKYSFNDHSLLNDGSEKIKEVLNSGDSLKTTMTAYIASSNGTQGPIDQKGVYYLFASVDEDNDFNEIDKSNNTDFRPIELTSIGCYYNTEDEIHTISFEKSDDVLFDIKAKTNCTYTINGQEEWITSPKNWTLSSNATVLVRVEANPFPYPRIGHISYGNKIYEFTQEARPCSELDDTIKLKILPETIMNIGCGLKGSINIEIEKGFPPYSYKWSNGSTARNLDNIETSGEYTLTVTDISGCEIQKTFNVTNDFNLDNSYTLNNGVLTANQNGVSYQWYKCANGSNVKIENETNQSFIPDELGEYLVEVYTGSCSKKSECISITTLNINSKIESIFNLFPNPANKVLNIIIPENYNNQFLKTVLYDTNGKKIKIIDTKIKNSKLELNVEDLSNGMYLLNFSLDNKNWSQIFIKK